MFSKLILLGKKNSSSNTNTARSTENTRKSPERVEQPDIVKVTIKGVYSGWFHIIMLVLIFFMISA